jgi:N-acetylmuramoyl-L-alanine amidase
MKHLKYMRLVILGLLFITLLPGFTQEQPDLNIVYPKNNANINAPSTFFVGSTSPKAKLTIDESPVAVYPNGSFVHVTDLKRGSNNIIIRSTLDNKEKTATYTINVPEYEKTIPNSPLKIDKTSIKPDQDMLLKPGDIINIKFKGSTGNNASFSIGSKKDIPMIELPPSYSKTPVVFGKAFETSQYPLKGIYNGVYTIRDSDNFQNEPVIIKLGSDNKNITEITGARISTISNNTPIVAEVIKDKAIVRTSPDKSRLTPLPKDTILNITGKIGSNYRFQMGKAMEGWIESKDVRLLPEGTPLAQSSVSSIKVESLPDSVLIKVPLSQKLPFNIEEVVNNQLSLSVYGGLADVNILSYNNDDLFIK